MAEDLEQKKQGWLQAFQSPELQTMLMQFGIAALQPQQPGVGGLSHFANALGASGEALARQQANTQQQNALQVEQQQRAQQLQTAERGVDVAADRNAVSREQIGSQERMGALELQSRQAIADLNRQTQLAITAAREKGESARLERTIGAREMDRAHDFTMEALRNRNESQMLDKQLDNALRVAQSKAVAEGQQLNTSLMTELLEQNMNEALLSDVPFDLSKAIGDYHTIIQGTQNPNGVPLPALGQFSREQFAQLYRNPANREFMLQSYGPTAVEAIARMHGVADAAAQPTAPGAGTPAAEAPAPQSNRRAPEVGGAPAVTFTEEEQRVREQGPGRLREAIGAVIDPIAGAFNPSWDTTIASVAESVEAMPPGPKRTRLETWLRAAPRIDPESRITFLDRLQKIMAGE